MRQFDVYTFDVNAIDKIITVCYNSIENYFNLIAFKWVISLFTV